MNEIKYQGVSIVPSKIICVGRNYLEHIQELENEIPNDMVIFNKPNSAIGKDLYAFEHEPIHYEAEICFLYQAKSFSAVAVGLDLTKRGLQSSLKKKSLPWERAKAFNHSALFSDFVPFDSLESLSIELTINNTLRQQGSVSMMMYKPLDILEEVQTFMTLEDGDIVMTGTPKGVGEVDSGSTYTGKILNEGKTIVEHSWLAQ